MPSSFENGDNADSDSDVESFTETAVLLGYASKDPTDDTISHLGGTPVRPPSRKPDMYLYISKSDDPVAVVG